jgi:hypothetical protein
MRIHDQLTTRRTGESLKKMQQATKSKWVNRKAIGYWSEIEQREESRQDRKQ